MERMHNLFNADHQTDKDESESVYVLDTDKSLYDVREPEFT